MTQMIQKHGWMLRAMGIVIALVTARVFGQEEAQAETWLAKQRTDTSAWEALSNKWEESSAATTTPVENIVLPLDHHVNGRIRAVLRAEKAHLLGNDLVFAWNVKIDLLLPDGTPDGTLVAEDCLMDRINRRGFCRGAVEVKKGPDHLKGRGMYFSTDEQFIKLLSECEIRTTRIPSRFGRLS